MKKLICDTCVFYPDLNRQSDLEIVIKKCNILPSPNLGNCMELFMSLRNGEEDREKNFQARERLLSFSDKIIILTPCEILDLFFPFKMYCRQREPEDSFWFWRCFKNGEDKFLENDLSDHFRKQHSMWLKEVAKFMNDNIQGFHSWSECTTHAASMPLDMEKEYVKIFLASLTNKEFITDDLVDKFVCEYLVFTKVLRTKCSGMKVSGRLKKNDIFDLMQFLYVRPGDYFITCEVQICEWLDAIGYKMCYEGSGKFKLYEINTI